MAALLLAYITRIKNGWVNWMSNMPFGSKSSPKSSGRAIIIVSGLPRSGTSLMMNMLSEGGSPLLFDSVRKPDKDNPNGYFEYEPVKKLADGETYWLVGAKDKAVKIISALLEYLPPSDQYKILFMERRISEILSSQRKMLAGRNEPSGVSDLEMEQEFTKHLAAVKFWLARQPNMEVLYVDYNKMMAEPATTCQAVANFLDLPLNLDKMCSIPNNRLYRNRSSNS
jgi:Sulfotransferase domain